MITRLEVIDKHGRVYSVGPMYGDNVRVTYQIQDDGRTLKVFVDDITPVQREDGDAFFNMEDEP